MKRGRLNPVGVATPSIERSAALYREMLGTTKIHEPIELPAPIICRPRFFAL